MNETSEKTENHTFTPYIVWIASRPIELAETKQQGILVWPVSKHTSFGYSEDWLLPEGVLNEAAMAEEWNEQPMLLEQLDRKIGKVERIEMVSACEGREVLEEELIAEFREVERENTTYLRQGVEDVWIEETYSFCREVVMS